MANYIPHSTPPGLKSSTRDHQPVLSTAYSQPYNPSPLRHSEAYSPTSSTSPTASRKYEKMHSRDDSNTAAQDIPLLPQLPKFTPLQMMPNDGDDDDAEGERSRAPPIYLDPYARHGGYVWKQSQHRPPYLSLSEAVYDESAPDFDPNNLSNSPASLYAEEKHPNIETPMGGSRRTGDNYRYSDTNSYSPRVLYPRGLHRRRPPRKHPFARGFEPPRYRSLALHFALCALTYPVLLIAVTIARGKSLFWTRVFVGAGTGVAGFALGLSLIGMGRDILEAATWATVIHQSRVVDGPGVRLKDLEAHSSDPTSLWPALRLLWDRHAYPGTNRVSRKSYDSRRWTIYILFFLFIVILSVSLPFVFGRIVNIETHMMHQSEKYTEMSVSADLSSADIGQADKLQSVFENYNLTWTLAAFSTHGMLPPVVSLSWANENVYFSEVSTSQLVPNGHGFGTFQVDSMAPSVSLDEAQQFDQSEVSVMVDPGAILRFPRWGLRIRCASIPDGMANIVPQSEANMTYLFTPRETLRTLFTDFNITFPDILEKPANLSQVIDADDIIPAELNILETALGAKFLGDGTAHNLKSTPLSMGEDGNGFMTIENVLIRLNTSYAPVGTFSRFSNKSIPDADGNPTYIGYDAAVCLELYEPWVLEVYNSTVGLPSSTRICNKGGEIEDMNTQNMVEKNVGTKLNNPGVKEKLESTSYRPAYIVAHQNSMNQILKDNGHDESYVPSPTLISFTDGQGPFGYTSLSSTAYANARAFADATNVLPYFAGSGLLLTRQYPDLVVTEAWINTLAIIVALIFIFLVGAVAVLFVPTLPLAVPRRGFDVYSWLAAFQGSELVAVRTSGLTKSMELDEIARQVGDLRFRYVD